ncbi:MAG: TnpV protein [Candidatus Faecousia sp.]|uniref:TnpV protein n=1 Tax=Faecousia sp. TaxID=2952921 RepID=UPI002A8CB5DD|nr:TnpV protein [Candidatus Faecousia sp.]
MEQFIFDERNGLWYELCGDYYVPCLETPESPRAGKFGRLRSTFLREHRGAIYTRMLFSGKLNAHLEEIDRQANELLDQLIEQHAAAEQITEERKANDQLAWVQTMNSIRNRAEEVVLSELIYC